MNAAQGQPQTEQMSLWRELMQFANILTLIRIVLTPVFVWAFLSGSWELRVLGLAVFVFAAITDWWDGHYARKSKSVTQVGRFLDPLADKLLTISAMLAFVWEFDSLLMFVLVAIIFVRDMLLTWLRARAEGNGHKFVTLWFAKLKTTVQLTAIITIIVLWCAYTTTLEFGIPIDFIDRDTLILVFDAMIGVTALFAVVSAGQYLRRIATKEQPI
jgi:CDP-diacylglycerol---glycerol-3-phosphate 3-phosphatidyltransferase